jgi:hypothetical protein
MPSKQFFEQRSIRYAINIQNALFLVSGISLVALILLIFFTNPYTFSEGLMIFWFLNWTSISAVIAYIQFWWIFSYKANLIYINKVNNILYSSVIYSGLLIYLLTLILNAQFNYVNVIIVLILIFAYRLFIKQK